MADRNDETLDNNQENEQNRDEQQKVSPQDALRDSIQERFWAQEQSKMAEQGADDAETIDADEQDEAPEVQLPKQVQNVAKPVQKAAPPATADDPVQKYVTVKDGVPYFKAKVDGQETLIPLEKVHQQAQKHESADVRLQKATALMNENQTRAQQLQQQHAALQTRVNPPSPPVNSDANDEAAVVEDAKKLTKMLLHGTEEQATEVLVEVLSKNRQAARPVVNTEEIVKQTAVRVRQDMSQEQLKTAMVSGLSKFKADFPEIASDARLFDYADKLSEEVEKANPSWTPEQVFTETGRQTREWVESLKGPVKKTSKEDTSSLASRREQNKQKLRPMPSSRVERQPLNEVEQPETAASVLAEMRKARGQS